MGRPTIHLESCLGAGDGGEDRLFVYVRTQTVGNYRYNRLEREKGAGTEGKKGNDREER